MTDAYRDIEEALQSILNNIPGHPYIVWENEETYKPNLPTLFWRVTNIPGISERRTAAIGRNHPGTYKIEVFVPRDQGLATLIDNLITIDTAYNTITAIQQGDTKIQLLAPYRGVNNHENAFLSSSVKIPYIGYN